MNRQSEIRIIEHITAQSMNHKNVCTVEQDFQLIRSFGTEKKSRSLNSTVYVSPIFPWSRPGSRVFQKKTSSDQWNSGMNGGRPCCQPATCTIITALQQTLLFSNEDLPPDF